MTVLSTALGGLPERTPGRNKPSSPGTRTTVLAHPYFYRPESECTEKDAWHGWAVRRVKSEKMDAPRGKQIRKKGKTSEKYCKKIKIRE